MQYTINQLRNEVFSRVYQVYEIFQNYFGENHVDLQGLPSDDDMQEVIDTWDGEDSEYENVYCITEDQYNSIVQVFSWVKPFILVYWPTVKVTNENDKSIIINDLYAKISLNAEGFIPTESRGFLINRATYPINQWVSNYLHSHISGIPKNRPEEFQLPCLGTGPINDTIASLKSDISEGFDEVRWMLFCEELSRYVTVESLKGVPYKKLENIGQHRQMSSYRGFNHSADTIRLIRAFQSDYYRVLKEFTLYYLNHGHLSFNFQDNAFKIGLSYYDYIINISNCFIDYFNSTFNDSLIAEACYKSGLLVSAFVADGKFYYPENNTVIPDVSGFIGKKVCDFKGHEVTLNILPLDSCKEPQKTTILDHNLAMYILDNILKIINYRYTNEHTRQHQQGTDFNKSSVLPAPTCQRAYYL